MNRDILVISEDRRMVRHLRRLLADDPLAFIWERPGGAGGDRTGQLPVSAVLVDGQLSGALAQVRAVRTADPDVPVILVASAYSSQEEVQARRLGAFYVVDTGEDDNLYRFLRRASELEDGF